MTTLSISNGLIPPACSAEELTAQVRSALLREDLDQLQYFADRGQLDVNAIDKKCGVSLLTVAILERKFALARFLVEHGAELERVCPRGGTALSYAVEVEDSEMVQYLIAKGANVHVKLGAQLNLLDWATATGCDGPVREILRSQGLSDECAHIRLIAVLFGIVGSERLSTGEEVQYGRHCPHMVGLKLAETLEEIVGSCSGEQAERLARIAQAFRRFRRPRRSKLEELVAAIERGESVLLQYMRPQKHFTALVVNRHLLAHCDKTTLDFETPGVHRMILQEQTSEGWQRLIQTARRSSCAAFEATFQVEAWQEVWKMKEQRSPNCTYASLSAALLALLANEGYAQDTARTMHKTILLLFKRNCLFQFLKQRKAHPFAAHLLSHLSYKLCAKRERLDQKVPAPNRQEADELACARRVYDEMLHSIEEHRNQSGCFQNQSVSVPSGYKPGL